MWTKKSPTLLVRDITSLTHICGIWSNGQLAKYSHFLGVGRGGGGGYGVVVLSVTPDFGSHNMCTFCNAHNPFPKELQLLLIRFVKKKNCKILEDAKTAVQALGQKSLGWIHF